MTVAVLGASKNPERYSNKAVKMLLEHKHRVIPVNPAQKEIEGLSAAALKEINEKVDTLTLYLGPRNLEPQLDAIIDLMPRRVIFNPGTESPEMKTKLEAAGISCVEACTLVMLRTGQFD